MNDIITQLTTLGFAPAASSADYLTRSIHGYSIGVRIDSENPKRSLVDYGGKITVGNRGICRLNKPEHIVQLECVLRLLEIGYPASNIGLERRFPAGHGHSGKLDIIITTDTGSAFAMIECKKPGSEYIRERNNLLDDGGQLFTYLAQDRSARVLALYTAKIDTVIKHNADVILTETLDLTGGVADIFSSWDRRFAADILFDKATTPYDLTQRALTASHLHDLDRETGKGLFNSFAEVLRRNVISDKSNAFTKIFNLFICKIRDEDVCSDPTNRLDFQVLPGDTSVTLLSRLTRLYQEGLRQYLNLEVDTGYLVRINGTSHIAIGEFSFIDVFDDETFEQNAVVVQEVVQVLEHFRLKYSQKHQFLGEFFEQLLNSGIKQEAGQYFTPVPLARFFLRSIPFRKIVKTNISNKEVNILPYIIDFACGAGHFLTEALDEYEEILPDIEHNLLTKKAKAHLNAYGQDLLWASEYVYGIDKDHRLSKTTKVALFLNGDGDARIINGDGLDDFRDSGTYVGRLSVPVESKDNRRFNVVVSNPPFSVDGFIKYVPSVSKNYWLARFATQKSSEIECFFIERMVQLLQPEGFGGIVLPLSVISSGRSVYRETRALLLILTRIRGIVEFRDKAFMATGTTTIALFTQRRPDDEVSEAIQLIASALIDKEESSLSRLREFCSNEWLQTACQEVEASPTQLRSLTMLTSREMTQINSDDGRIPVLDLPTGLRFILTIFLNANDQIVAGFSGERKEQENFLGYRFSNARGREGIFYIKDSNGQLDSRLYNPDDTSDPTRVSTHIRSAFEGQEIVVPDELQGHVEWLGFRELFSGETNFSLYNPSRFFASDVSTISPHGDFIEEFEQIEITLKELADSGEVWLSQGVTYDRTQEVPRPTGNPVITSSYIDLTTGRLRVPSTAKHLVDEFDVDERLRPRSGDLLVSLASGSLKHLAKVAYVDTDQAGIAGGFVGIIRCTDAGLAMAIYYRLMSKKFREFVVGQKDQNINNLNLSRLATIPMYIPADVNAFRDRASALESAR